MQMASALVDAAENALSNESDAHKTNLAGGMITVMFPPRARTKYSHPLPSSRTVRVRLKNVSGINPLSCATALVAKS